MKCTVPAGERAMTTASSCTVERASHASKAESGELSGSCLHLSLVPRALSTRCRRQMQVGGKRVPRSRRLSQTPPVEGQWRLQPLRLACRSTHRTSSTGRTEVRKGQRMHDMVACAWRLRVFLMAPIVEGRQGRRAITHRATRPASSVLARCIAQPRCTNSRGVDSGICN